MENVEKFRWAFIGSGGIAQKVAKQILGSKRHSIVSVYSRNYKNASKFASSVGAAAFETIEEAVAREDVDGVYICNANGAHFACGMAALKAGKPTVIEKPFTLNAKDAETLFTTAKQQKVYLAEAMWTWYNPVARQVKKWIDDGHIGKIIDIDYKFELNLLFFKKKKERLLSREPGSGALYDLGVYPIAYACRLLGMPMHVRGVNRYQSGIDVGNEIVMNYPENVGCHITVAIDRLRGENAVIAGEKGTIIVPAAHAAKKAYMLLDDGRKKKVKGGGNYIYEFDEIAREIREGLLTSELVPFDMTIDVLQVIGTIRATCN